MNHPLSQPEIAGGEVSLLRGYVREPARYDEMLDETGNLRPHWEQFAGALERFGPEELARRASQAQQLIKENGITYNVYGDPQGMDRPWALDLLPAIVSPGEWAHVARGLEQRAHLINLVLADLYGPQRLIREGVLPPEIVFANPRFLRPCHDIAPPKTGHVVLFAADLARDEAGAWTVLSDRSQSPSGSGYALENRIVMSRVFPNMIRVLNVRRLASFFETYRTVLRDIAPFNRDNPRVALLTPGPFNETYFEHVYLARYLGFVLVEGQDLTVRDNRVFMKTLEGLRPVDVIVRRLDDDYCDPLELRSDSTLGLPGLVQAAESGNVTVANALGSGLAEALAMPAFLPRLCQYFLGEELVLPSNPAWWCGEAEGLARVEARFDELLIGPAFSGGARAMRDASALSRPDRDALLERVRANPIAFVAHQRPSMSSAPCWEGNALAPGRIVMRSYAVSEGGGAHAVMPGGLSRVARAEGGAAISMQQGSGSKDIWVCSETPAGSHSLLPGPGQPLVLRRATGDLPSRVAENLCWLGRYTERAEGAVRLLRFMLTRITDESGIASAPELPHLLRAAALQWPEAVPPRGPDGALPPEAMERAIFSAIFDETPANSITANLMGLQRLGWVVRDRFSVDSWRILNNLIQEFLAVQASRQSLELAEALVCLNGLVTGLAAFSGLSMENMTRSPSWRFLDIGRRIERTLHTARLLGGALLDPAEPEAPVLLALLSISDSAMTYRGRYGASFQTEAVLDLLLVDETNPRSAAFQVNAFAEHLAALPQTSAAGLLSAEERIATRVLSELRLADLESLARPSRNGRRVELEGLLLRVQQWIPAFSDELARRYFSHTAPKRQIETQTPERAP